MLGLSSHLHFPPLLLSCLLSLLQSQLHSLFLSQEHRLQEQRSSVCVCVCVRAHACTSKQAYASLMRPVNTESQLALQDHTHITSPWTPSLLPLPSWQLAHPKTVAPSLQPSGCHQQRLPHCPPGPSHYNQPLCWNCTPHKRHINTRNINI